MDISNSLATKVVFDFDGTLADPTNRLPYLIIERNVEKFYKAALDDTQVETMFDLFTGYLADNPDDVYILTSRREHHRQVTLEWLSKQGVEFDSSHLIMASGDRVGDVQVFDKVAWLKANKDTIMAYFDNDPKLISYSINQGIYGAFHVGVDCSEVIKTLKELGENYGKLEG